jgi:hypothetical protein
METITWKGSVRTAKEKVALIRTLGIEAPLLRSALVSALVVLVLFAVGALVHPPLEFPLLLSLAVCIGVPLLILLAPYLILLSPPPSYVVSASGIGSRDRLLPWARVDSWDVDESAQRGAELCLLVSDSARRIPLPGGEKRERILAVVATHAARDGSARQPVGPPVQHQYPDLALILSVGAGLLLGFLMMWALVRLDLPPQWVMLSLLVLGPGTISVSLVPGFGEARPALRWSVAVLLNWLCVVVAFFVWALAAVAWIARGV